MSFRQPPDLEPMNFDDFSIQIRHFLDQFLIHFRRIFELFFDELSPGTFPRGRTTLGPLFVM